jgi:hypothetical protein
MEHAGTERDCPSGARPESDAPARRELVVISGGQESGSQESGGQESASQTSGFRPVPARPLSGFLAQLLVSVEPTLRPSRIERTRSAAAHYAAAARRA